MVNIFSDIAFLLLALFVYVVAFELKRDTVLFKSVVYGTFVLMATAYVLTVYAFQILSEGAAIILCITLPSFLVLSVTAKHRDARFIITFCFIDTIMLTIALIQRIFAVTCGAIGGIISTVALITLVIFVMINLKPFVKKYNSIMTLIKDGWAPSTLCTVSIYVVMLFIFQYPTPISTRPEYYPVYASVAFLSVCFYYFFICNIVQKSRMYETNTKLAAERKWHEKAYVDPVTGVKNRMAYVKNINELERDLDKSSVYYAVMIDVNNFKTINDTLGHHKGDEMLCHLAKLLTSIFPKENYEVYRIGGDEFAIIGRGIEEYDVDGRISAINVSVESSRMGYSVAAGRATVRNEENQAFENAFIRADEAMYESKRLIKERASLAADTQINVFSLI